MSELKEGMKVSAWFFTEGGGLYRDGVIVMEPGVGAMTPWIYVPDTGTMFNCAQLGMVQLKDG